ncbi:type III restriction endonuclease subunit R, partial [bacterium]|nr:type III restriction endonuclease subunit R [bacterium]
VMITVANRTETAARVKYSFDHNHIKIDELCDPERTLHIDSKVLKKAEEESEPVYINNEASEEDDEGANGDSPETKEKPEKKLTKKNEAELLRRQVDTVGREGKEGELIQNVISVGMLSEGWDAKTVTHIMGLRAFSSQLLCEQVVGRGLRRTSYDINPDGLYETEYVNIFGVPFTFLPHESTESTPKPSKPKTLIEPVPEKQEFEIKIPNVIRIEYLYKPKLTLDIEKVEPIYLKAYDSIELVEIAPIVEGKPDITKISQIDLEELGRKQRTQRIIFESARDVYDQMKTDWKGDKNDLMSQVILIIEQFFKNEKIKLIPPDYALEDIKRRILITLNMNKVVQHIWQCIRYDNLENIVPVYDNERPIISTWHMRSWYTGKPVIYTKKSHINFCVLDSAWESTGAFALDENENVTAWVKNDHIGFKIYYTYRGIVHSYRPDFIIKLKNDEHLILETKGQETHEDIAKRKFLEEWIKAVNNAGDFGKWHCAVSRDPMDVAGIIEKVILFNGDRPDGLCSLCSSPRGDRDSGREL